MVFSYKYLTEQRRQVSSLNLSLQVVYKTKSWIFMMKIQWRQVPGISKSNEVLQVHYLTHFPFFLAINRGLWAVPVHLFSLIYKMKRRKKSHQSITEVQVSVIDFTGYLA